MFVYGILSDKSPKHPMSNKFNNQYRIPSARLSLWDYGAAAAYFITICTKDRQHFFGDIQQGVMHLSPLVIIAQQEWENTFTVRTDMALTMSAFVVMPNHFHAIVIIGDNAYNGGGGNMDRTPRKNAMPRRDAMHCVSTNANTKNDTAKNAFAPQSKNLASIVRGFKSAVTTQARKMGDINFNWQPRYHDHIIRDAQSFHNIEQYIIDNPKKWAADMFIQGYQ
jgi:REP element-mobilizing transposase RayT